MNSDSLDDLDANTKIGSDNEAISTKILQEADGREDESWSDEEGEDPTYTYNYSLGRRR